MALCSNEVEAREGIDTLTEESLTVDSGSQVAMRLKPVRALTLYNSDFTAENIEGSNEVEAREGIDTFLQSSSQTTPFSGSNEVEAREGIDTRI